MPEVSFKATIIKGLTKFFEDTKAKSPDAKHNRGQFVTEAFFWDVLQDYAKKQSDLAWGKLEDEEIIDPSEELGTGDHTLAETPAFSITLKQSEPRKNFNAEALQEALKKKYRVPTHTSAEMIAAAKLPGNPVRTFRIVER